MKKLLLIINPNAGTRQKRRFLPDMLTIFNEADYLPTVFMTRGRGDASSFAAEYAGKTDVVVACGGDGTLNEVISGMLTAGHTTPIGYIPCGSTNDFATSLGISVNVLQACRDIVNGEPRELDIGLFGPDRYFSYTASFGLFASVSYSTPQNVKNILGHAAYILEGIRSLADVRPVHLAISADGKTYEDDYLFGTVCNSVIMGGGVLRLDERKVHLNDGLFESLLIPFPKDLGTVKRILDDIGAKQYEESPLMSFIRASDFTVKSDPPTHWTLDGEEAVAAPVQEIRNLKSAIQIVCKKLPASR